ncbi:hypothetical protein OS188_10730 [Xanthomarina sp. F1114]|uniref:hypothetical protein n=1 Tax=Xanthomarina sp. F1114 TaxID=2996019 RepID=UPI00225E0D67|nr:hypothetical protein [Xanthomarina sp. F1114]MCX7548425.1 hypothetical protein [Xanthomarina sp. F1114]
MRKVILMFAVLFTLSIALTGCRDEKTAGDKIENTADDIGDGIEDAADDVGDAVDDAADEVEDAVDGK